MNPSKVELGLFHHHLDPIVESQPLILNQQPPPPPPPPSLDFALPPLSEFDLFHDDDDDSGSPTSSDNDSVPPATHNFDDLRPNFGGNPVDVPNRLTEREEEEEEDDDDDDDDVRVSAPVEAAIADLRLRLRDDLTLPLVVSDERQKWWLCGLPDHEWLCLAGDRIKVFDLDTIIFRVYVKWSKKIKDFFGSWRMGFKTMKKLSDSV